MFSASNSSLINVLSSDHVLEHKANVFDGPREVALKHH